MPKPNMQKHFRSDFDKYITKNTESTLQLMKQSPFFIFFIYIYHKYDRIYTRSFVLFSLNFNHFLPFPYIARFQFFI